MAQGTGRLMLLKVESTEGSGTFDTNVCGFNSRSMTLGNTLEDATVVDCGSPGNKVEEALTAGLQVLAFTGSGKAVSDASHRQLFQDCLDQRRREYQVEDPVLGTIQCFMYIENYELSGEQTGNLDFSATFRSDGAKTFSAAV